MGLYRAELRRLGKRRAVRYLVLAGLLVLVAVVVGTFLSNKKIDPAAWAAAERTAEQEFRNAVDWTQQWQAECERSHASGTPDLDKFPPDCADITMPVRAEFLAEYYLPPTFGFRSEFPATFYTFASVMALVFFLAGASFVGAEWSSGAMMNLLLWRPQRLRVLFTKLAALLTGTLAVTVLAALLWTAAYWLVAQLRGTPDGVTADVWRAFALIEVRSVALVVCAAAAGFGLASIGRNTALALGFLAAALDVRYPELWLLPTYFIAWMDSSIELTDWHYCELRTAPCEPPTWELTWVHSGLLAAGVLAVVLGVAAWTMRRRDIA
jgi:ABC-2 type transport system permease protein